ncbi:MAG: hypothetical protein OIF51_08035 [Cellvibrionaceae bacterium]|nr:hypothetical protein [Cellvibrionaceae bacterium]
MIAWHLAVKGHWLIAPTSKQPKTTGKLQEAEKKYNPSKSFGILKGAEA